MTVRPMFSDPLARQLYAEVAAIEEQHVTQYESIIDPNESWLEMARELPNPHCRRSRVKSLRSSSTSSPNVSLSNAPGTRLYEMLIQKAVADKQRRWQRYGPGAGANLSRRAESFSSTVGLHRKARRESYGRNSVRRCLGSGIKGSRRFWPIRGRLSGNASRPS